MRPPTSAAEANRTESAPDWRGRLPGAVLARKLVFGFASNARGEANDAIGRREGGVYKRIDETREMAELLQEQAPELLIKHPWVMDWLRANDRFLNAVAEAFPCERYTCPPQGDGLFPRHWPMPDTGWYVDRQGEPLRIDDADRVSLRIVDTPKDRESDAADALIPGEIALKFPDGSVRVLRRMTIDEVARQPVAAQ